MPKRVKSDETAKQQKQNASHRIAITLQRLRFRQTDASPCGLTRRTGCGSIAETNSANGRFKE